MLCRPVLYTTSCPLTIPKSLDRPVARTFLHHPLCPSPLVASRSEPSPLDIPGVPYIKAFQTQLVAHFPPDPYGSHQYEYLPLNVKWLPDVPVAQAVLQIPPSESSSGRQSKTVGFPDTGTCYMEIVRVIAGGPERGAQLVKSPVTNRSDASVGKTESPFEAVAKIFDPLYYGPNILHPYIDCCAMHRADGDYSREAAAYEAP